VTVHALLDGWEAAWSSRDPGAFAEVCSPRLHYEDPLTPEPLEGPEELGTHAERLWDAFPDARIEKTGQRLVDGRFAAAPCRLLGSHRGALGGLPPSDRSVMVHAVFYCEVEHDRLLRVRGFCDLYDAAVQLGVLPERGSLGARALLMLRGYGLRGGAAR